LTDIYTGAGPAGVVAEFAYQYDSLGRRTGVTKTGAMFARYSANGLDTAWGYNDRSELTSEQTRLSLALWQNAA
jgi:hypothetical protein